MYVNKKLYLDRTVQPGKCVHDEVGGSFGDFGQEDCGGSDGRYEVAQYWPRRRRRDKTQEIDIDVYSIISLNISHVMLCFC